MSNTRLFIMSVWVAFFGYPFLHLSWLIYGQLTSGIIAHFFSGVWGVSFFIIGVPPLIVLEKGMAVSKRRRKYIFIFSCVGFFCGSTLLLALLTAGSAFAVGLGVLMLLFFPLYVSMGSWVLCVIWFLIVNRKYGSSSHGSIIYSYISNLVVISACLLIAYLPGFFHPR